MAYDDELAARVRELVEGEAGLSEKRMFGAHAFLVHGHLAVSASSRGGLMLRVDPAEEEALLADPRAEPFVMRGKELAGWLHVDVDAGVDEDELKRWVSRGIDYARSLPPKR
jgi:TfoX/Sxy family transcriptional regulator of competence genes